MITTNDGGPAFAHCGAEFVQEQSGMSLRDFFAAQSLTDGEYLRVQQAFHAQNPGRDSVSQAELRYFHADQMLRAKGGVQFKEQARESVLVEALKKIISMNRQQAHDQYGDPDKAESWGCVETARAALAAGGVA